MEAAAMEGSFTEGKNDYLSLHYRRLYCRLNFLIVLSFGTLVGSILGAGALGVITNIWVLLYLGVLPMEVVCVA